MLLLHMLNRKRKRYLLKLLMQILAHTQIASNVTIITEIANLKEIVVGGKQLGIHIVTKDLEKTFI